jgi:hypothetical protein
MQDSLVLVLNASYEPLQLVRLERAIKLIYLAKAEIVEATDGRVCSWLIEVARPSVIRLLRIFHCRTAGRRAHAGASSSVMAIPASIAARSRRSTC